MIARSVTVTLKKIILGYLKFCVAMVLRHIIR